MDLKFYTSVVKRVKLQVRKFWDLIPTFLGGTAEKLVGGRFARGLNLIKTFIISKFKSIFAKGYTPNWRTEIFIVDKINDTAPYTYNLKDLNCEEVIGSFYDRELQKTKL